MNKLTEKEEKERMDLYKQGLSDGQMAKILGLTKSPILKWRTSRGLPRNYKPRFQPGNQFGRLGVLPKEEHELRMRLYNKGLIDKEVAKVCHVSKDAISQWRRKYNLPANGRYRKNEE